MLPCLPLHQRKALDRLLLLVFCSYVAYRAEGFKAAWATLGLMDMEIRFSGTAFLGAEVFTKIYTKDAQVMPPSKGCDHVVTLELVYF